MKRGQYWPFLIVGLLGLALSFNLSLLVYSLNDPSFAVEKDYYKKAINWDKKVAQEERNRRLGWRIVLPKKMAAHSQKRRLCLQLHDRDGSELLAAQIQVIAFHNARASQQLQAHFLRHPTHGYCSPLLLARQGLWEFRFTIIHRGRFFTHTHRRSLAAASKG